MLQEYLPGEEFSVDVYVRCDGIVVGAVPRERMKVDSGIAVASRTVNSPEVDPGGHTDGGDHRHPLRRQRAVQAGS